ncbi:MULTISPECIES: ABC transporter ATP-binding protein [Peptoniphilaceae]|uniref:ABC transporter ATP-binding protein n=1 Tax=Anaerococcus hydrogenalis TaxID=33029 RepID=A0A2N6UJ62_9FIRM|nr:MULTISPECIES: ABC transporter ATP-binding protein [Peptoniphilaceae]MDK7695242.1 ABC transporter ATP-binding protein [Anaerococcus hydrogenalis]MDK7696783.1 ABC transporter ATP-binding protein [Anaerococcus hydrogenalis]MDK7708269.1 ABC transporter ATP-binding protein [Anaerococcus hydrogenalis]MDU5186052.1 ABC transporter ATP-binding protein [Finegoldia magna]MDU5273021.1 ABC transporter ATP-binding protein [Finegoldia magna]
MKNYLKDRFALTDKGAEGTIVAIKYSTLKSLSYMLPMFLLMYVMQGLLGLGKFNLKISVIAYIVIALIMMFVINRDYITTYNETYKESANLRIELSEIIKDLPLSFYSKRDLTDFSQTIMKDVEAMEHGLSHAVSGFYGFIINLVIISILLLIGNVKLGLAVIVPIYISAILNLTSTKMQKKATATYYKEQRKSSKMFQELIDLSTEIKSYNLTEEKEKSGIDFVRSLEKKHIKSELGQVIPIVSATVVANLSLALAIYVGLNSLINGEINILYFAGYLFASARLIDGVAAFNQFYGELMYIDSPIEKIKALRSEEIQPGIETEFKSFDIEGKNVEFSYLDDKKVIDNISFKALQGKTTALVGPSGCGKSTLIKLVARLYDYDRGEILIDEKEINKSRTEDLFKHISMVFQDVTLFNGSVMENIRLGRSSASDEEVLEAARLANCDEFVKKLENGYDTEIGENGSNLSGGERQRISIARAFLKDAEIILLDEIAASLDVENEKYIQESLNKLIKNKTVMIVSHRMKSIRNVDQIIVMKDGKIEDFGKHDELLKSSKTYQKMIESSKKSEEFIY